MKRKIEELGAKTGLETKEIKTLTKIGLSGLLTLTLSALAGGEARGGPEPQPQDAARIAQEQQKTGFDRSRCDLQPDQGPCKGLFKKYYFDAKDSRCRSFTYGGCEGTVPFETYEECQKACQAAEPTVKDEHCGPFPGYPCGTKYHTVSVQDFGLRPFSR